MLSILICLLSALGAGLVQSAGGAVTVKDLRIETASGRTLSAILLKPKDASASDKRPAVVTTHGWWNNKEMQDANYVELARRGYVVMAIDLYGHGDSDALPRGEEAVGGTGMYDAVKAVATLPYVDQRRIGITGHSNGARASNWAVTLDNKAPTQLIKAVYLVDNEPLYTEKNIEAGGGRGPVVGAYSNLYGTRDVGLMADKYDEFFFRSYDSQGKKLTTPREYIDTAKAQSFLHFGADPAGLDRREAHTTYTQQIGGKSAIRQIETPAHTHPWSPESTREVSAVVSFFEKSLGAPNPIPSDSQVWVWKAVFNFVGLIALGVFVVTFAKWLLGLSAFNALRSRPAEAAPLDRRGQLWFWGGLTVSAVLSALSYWIMQANTTLAALSFVPQPPLNSQGAVFFVALWAAVNGVIALVVMTASWLLFGHTRGQSLREIGVLPGWRAFGLAIVVALATTAAAYGIVFAVHYLFHTDFRFWVLGVKAFTADKLVQALIYLPLFLVFYVANAVAVNCFNRSPLRGRDSMNLAVVAVFNALGAIFLVAWQYIHFFTTGELVSGFGGIFGIWLFPVIVFLIVAPIVSRKIYRVTNNPYIGGVIMAIMATLISVTNTLTYR